MEQEHSVIYNERRNIQDQGSDLMGEWKYVESQKDQLSEDYVKRLEAFVNRHKRFREQEDKRLKEFNEAQQLLDKQTSDLDRICESDYARLNILNDLFNSAESFLEKRFADKYTKWTNDLTSQTEQYHKLNILFWKWSRYCEDDERTYSQDLETYQSDQSAFEQAQSTLDEAKQKVQQKGHSDQGKNDKIEEID